MKSKIVYGPVPSRRLGQSLGINNIPPKICTYSCVYCQLGRTLKMQLERDKFYTVEDISQTVKQKVDDVVEKDEDIDHLTFVPDGEPTLDINLGEEIKAINRLGLRVAVISNSSLLWDERVRDNLMSADLVSIKIDAVTLDTWKKVNRPHGRLELDRIIDGLHKFSSDFSGELNTETMLVQGLNDSIGEIKRIADRIVDIGADRSYIAIPTRPPAVDWVEPPGERKITEAYKIFEDKGLDVEYLIGYEGDTFATTGNIKEDLLSITSVHPMRERQIRSLLIKTDEDWSTVEELLDEGELVETEFKDEKFYMRKLG